tara:strand:- start:11266 stop:12261 length:996 start_codon:yes stop_codon:yes gene_type:complete
MESPVKMSRVVEATTIEEKEFMAHWTPNEIADLSGKTVLITGANSGIGFETAVQLAARSARVVVSCRSQEKANQTLQRIQQLVPGAQLSAITMELSDLDSVALAADAFLSTHGQLDCLVNNAGVMGLPLLRNARGHEMVFAVSHFGHFALTAQLLPALRAATQARVVTVSSLAARKGQLLMNDLHWQHTPYSKVAAYGRAKLANLSFALELQRRFDAAGMDALSLAAHPGYAATNVAYASDAPAGLRRRLWEWIAYLGNRILAQPAEQGAWPTLYAATSPAVSGGDYIGPAGPFEFRGPPTKVAAVAAAQDQALAAELWCQSEDLCGVRLL